MPQLPIAVWQSRIRGFIQKELLSKLSNDVIANIVREAKGNGRHIMQDVESYIFDFQGKLS